MAGIQRPVILDDNHNVESFCSGHDSLDDWLKNKAKSSALKGTARTYVVAIENRVIAYYCWCTSSVSREELCNAKMRRNMPPKVPAILIGRLAVDKDWQGQGIGPALLQDAGSKATKLSRMIGVSVLFVHALSEDKVSFYTHHGFLPSSVDPLVLMLPIASL